MFTVGQRVIYVGEDRQTRRSDILRGDVLVFVAQEGENYRFKLNRQGMEGPRQRTLNMRFVDRLWEREFFPFDDPAATIRQLAEAGEEWRSDCLRLHKEKQQLQGRLHEIELQIAYYVAPKPFSEGDAFPTLLTTEALSLAMTNALLRGSPLTVTREKQFDVHSRHYSDLLWWNEGKRTNCASALPGQTEALAARRFIELQ